MAKGNRIHFFKEGIRFRLIKQQEIRNWLKLAAKKEGYTLDNLNFIFCDDKYLLEMNKEFLGHNYFTDIITFDNSIEKKLIEGDVFISIDTVRKNSERFKTTIGDELHRVMIHGLLHLMGYKDKTEKDKIRMKLAENNYLERFKSKK